MGSRLLNVMVVGVVFLFLCILWIDFFLRVGRFIGFKIMWMLVGLVDRLVSFVMCLLICFTMCVLVRVKWFFIMWVVFFSLESSISL